MKWAPKINRSTKKLANALGIVNALNNLAQIELGIEIDGGHTILQSRVAEQANGTLRQHRQN